MGRDANVSPLVENPHRHRNPDRNLRLFPDRCGGVDYADNLEWMTRA